MNNYIFSYPPAEVFRKLNYINPQTLDIDLLINSVFSMPYIYFKVPYHVWTDRITSQDQCDRLAEYLRLHKNVVLKELPFHHKHLLVFHSEFWKALNINLRKNPLTSVEVASLILTGYDPRYLIDRYRLMKRWFQRSVARCITIYLLTKGRRVVLPESAY